jgi:hypothetical protein
VFDKTFFTQSIRIFRFDNTLTRGTFMMKG